MFSELLREITDLTPWKESIDAYISNLSINSVIVTIMMIFMILGAVDKAMGNKRGYGAAFDEGFQAMGPLAIAMVGVIAAASVHCFWQICSHHSCFPKRKRRQKMIDA